MATLKFDYTGVCAGGGHAYIDIIVNGVKRATITVESDQLIDPPAPRDEAIEMFATTLLMFDRRKWLRDNPSGTNGQYLAHLEAEEWVF